MKIRIIFNAATFIERYFPSVKTMEQKDKLFRRLYPLLVEWCSIEAITEVKMGVKYHPRPDERAEPFLVGLLDDISTNELYRLSDKLETLLDQNFRQLAV